MKKKNENENNDENKNKNDDNVEFLIETLEKKSQLI